MISPDTAADALEAVMRKGSRADLAAVLGLALDRYELARLYRVARARLQAGDEKIRAELLARGYVRPPT